MNSDYWKGGCLLLALTLLPGAGVGGEALPAQLEWLRHIVLSTPETGILEKVSVGVGDMVQPGEELMRLDTRVQQAQLAEAEAAVAEAELLLAEADRERERTRELYERTLLADHDLQLAQIAYASARTSLARARAQRSAVQQQLDQRILRAPWTGRVTAVLAQSGQTVVSRLEAVPLIELVGEGEMLARSRVDLEQRQSLQTGMPLEVVAGGQRYAGVLHSLSWRPPSEASDAGFSMAVRFSVPAGVVLLPGMPARIQLP